MLGIDLFKSLYKNDGMLKYKPNRGKVVSSLSVALLSELQQNMENRIVLFISNVKKFDMISRIKPFNMLDYIDSNAEDKAFDLEYSTFATLLRGLNSTDGKDINEKRKVTRRIERVGQVYADNVPVQLGELEDAITTLLKMLFLSSNDWKKCSQELVDSLGIDKDVIYIVYRLLLRYVVCLCIVAYSDNLLVSKIEDILLSRGSISDVFVFAYNATREV